MDDIDDIVRNEVGRQVALLDVRDELASWEAGVGEPADVSAVFADTDSGLIGGALNGDGQAMAVRLDGFDGLVGRELQPDRRLGTEFADHAKRHGVGGVFHTDELPAYGVTEDEVAALREAVDADESDAVAMVAADPESASAAIEVIADRARVVIDGVPEETRGANDDGTTRYLRPLPGAARMYPKTDIPPVELDFEGIETPELLTQGVERYRSELGLDAGFAEQVAYGRRMSLSEAAVERSVDPTLAAGTVEMHRDRTQTRWRPDRERRRRAFPRPVRPLSGR